MEELREDEIVDMWISVYDSVYNSKLRKLYKRLECSEREALGLLINLWHWGLENATRDGLILDADADDIARVIDYHGAGSKVTGCDAIEALIETGWLEENVDGLYLHDWDVWQKQWYMAKDKRERDAETHRKNRAKKTDDFQEVPKRTRVTVKYSDEFLEFWELYPRNEDKGAAYKTYCSRLKDGYTHEQIMEATRAYVATVEKNHTQKKYIKHAKTFLGPSMPFAEYIGVKIEKREYTDGDPFADF